MQMATEHTSLTVTEARLNAQRRAVQLHCSRFALVKCTSDHAPCAFGIPITDVQPNLLAFLWMAHFLKYLRIFLFVLFILKFPSAIHRLHHGLLDSS